MYTITFTLGVKLPGTSDNVLEDAAGDADYLTKKVCYDPPAFRSMH